MTDTLGHYTHNMPAASPLEKATASKNSHVAAADRWLRLVRVENQAEADELSAFKAQLLGERAKVEASWDAAIAEPKRLIEAAKQTWGTIYDAFDLLLRQIEPKMRDWLVREKNRIDLEKSLAAVRAREEQERLDEIKRQAELAAVRAADTGEMPEDLATTAVAIQEQERAAEEAAREARRIEQMKPRAGGNFTAGGRRRSDGLRSVAIYSFPDRRKAVLYRLKHGNPKQLAELDDWLRKTAREDHMADKKAGRPTDFEKMACVMTEEMRS